MKKIIPLLFIVIFTFTACGKGKSTESDLEKWERELKEIYSYETPFIFSRERVENEVEYIEDMDVLVEEAVKIIRKRMREGYSTGNWANAWDGDSRDKTKAFNGKGYYICQIPITEYNNNRNALSDNFILYIFNEDRSVAGEAVFSNLDSKTLDVQMGLMSNYFGALSAVPEAEFINVSSNYLRDNYISNPNLIGGIEPRAATFGMLGEDNKLYSYDNYSDTIKELNKLNLYGGERLTVEGDLFHALPEEMRYSYDKIMDNLIWVEY
ncbi:MAG: hypothetical protein NC223_10495 [Butyrivibrio sp.]|nr:hypothetical protein [Butyrivibrio sp.]